MLRARTVGLPWIAVAALFCSTVAGAQTGEDSTVIAAARTDSRQHVEPAGQRASRRRRARAAISGARLRREDRPDAGFGEDALHRAAAGRRVEAAGAARGARRRRRRRAREVVARSVRRDREGRLRLRPRRDRLQGRHGGVRARGDDARRAKGAAGARRDLSRRGGRGERRAVQHVVAGARALGRHRRRVRAERRRLDHEGRRRPRALREHLDGRQVVDPAHDHGARDVDALRRCRARTTRSSRCRAAMAKISAYETPLTITPATKRFFIALVQDERAADVRLLSRPRRRRRGEGAGARTRS